MALTYLGLPVNLDNEFNSRFYNKADADTVNIYDVANSTTLNDVNILANTVVFGNFKTANNAVGFTRTYPVFSISAPNLFNYNRVDSGAENIPVVFSIPFWNYSRGDGKGFSVDLGANPIRLKVFQDVENSPCNRFTISTKGAVDNSDPIAYEEKNALNIFGNGLVSIGQTLSTANYPSSAFAGDALLNPFSLLVQNDINIGLDGLKTSSLARLHIKATSTEYSTNRFLAYFASGNGTNAAAITNDCEFLCNTPGRGLIVQDSTNSHYYRISMSNGVLVTTQIA